LQDPVIFLNLEFKKKLPKILENPFEVRLSEGKEENVMLIGSVISWQYEEDLTR
jgi:hypothetical protein